MILNVNAPDFQLPDSLQAIYDHVAGHLLRQGRPAMTEDEKGKKVCAYRSPDGDRCAIGALIPDARYRPDLEGRMGICVLADIGLLTWDEIENEGAPRVRLLSVLQHTHDVGHGVSPDRVAAFWERRLAIIAEKFGLRPFTRDMLSNKE